MSEPSLMPTRDSEPRHPDGLTDVLDAQSQRFSMDGHPASEVPPEETTPPPDTIPAPDGPVPDAAPAPAPEIPAYKYASQDEAERAAREAAQRMHEATEETAWLRRQFEELSRQSRSPETQPPAPVAPPAPEVPPFDAEAHFLQTYRQASQLDPNAEDYDEQQRDLVARRTAEAFQVYDQRFQEYERRLQTQHDEIYQELQARQTQQTQETEHDRVLGKLLAHAQTQGLDVDIPTADTLGGQHYQDVVLAARMGRYPPQAGEDDAIAAVVDYVRQVRHITPAAPVSPATPTVPAAPVPPAAPPAPMERSGTGRPPAAADDELSGHPATLDEALAGTLQMRQT